MRYKKQFFLLITSMLMIAIIGCSSSEATNDNGGSATGNNNSETIEISYGHGFMPETPHHRAALMFKEQVEEKSNGQVEVEIFPSDQLGTAREQLEGLQMGTQQIALLPTARISGTFPELQLFDLPFLFPTREIGYAIMDGPVGENMLDKLADNGIKGVAIYEDGLKHFTANKELRKPEDFEGLKFRTMESPIVMGQFEQLGANPTVIDFGELYNSLQQGVVDGQENPLVTIKNMKFYEVQDYVTLSEHGYLGHVLMFDENWFNSLSEDIQEILVTTGKELAKWQREEVQKEERDYLEEIKESGTEVIELTDDERELFREATLPVHEEYREINSELLDRVYEEIENLQ